MGHGTIRPLRSHDVRLAKNPQLALRQAMAITSAGYSSLLALRKAWCTNGKVRITNFFIGCRLPHASGLCEEGVRESGPLAESPEDDLEIGTMLESDDNPVDTIWRIEQQSQGNGLPQEGGCEARRDNAQADRYMSIELIDVHWVTRTLSVEHTTNPTDPHDKPRTPQKFSQRLPRNPQNPLNLKVER